MGTNTSTTPGARRLKLFEQQEEHVKALVQAVQTHGAALDSSETGTGKSVCAVEAARSLRLRPGVVCPKTVIAAWEACLKGQGVPGTVTNWEKARTGNLPILNRPAKRKFQWVLPPEALLIFDECHKAKGRNTLNSNMVIAAKRQGIPMLLLSATAAENPIEMRALGFAIGLHNLNNYWKWAQANGCIFDRWNSLMFPAHNRDRLVDLNKAIYPERGHKMTRESLGKHFRETRVVTDPVRFGKEGQIRDLLEELEEEMAQLESQKARDGDEPHVLTKILRLRQEVELLKIPEIVELVIEARDSGHAVAVFLNFNASLDALSSRLAEDHIFIRGGQRGTERDDSIAKFQSDQTNIALCNVAAGGVGVSLHDTHGNLPRIALISPTYNAKDFHQTLGRVDRLGGMSDSVQRVLVAENTIETKIVAAMMEKISNLGLLHANTSDKTIKPMHTKTEKPRSGKERLPHCPECGSTMTPTGKGTYKCRKCGDEYEWVEEEFEIRAGNPGGKKPEGEFGGSHSQSGAAGESNSPPSTSGPAHAKYSPSSLKYSAHCPGYKPKDDTNPAAEMGTRIHEALETGDWSGLQSDWEHSLAQACANAEDRLVAQPFGNRAFTAHSERRLGIDLIGHSTFGTCDKLDFTSKDGRLQIAYKTGKGAIDEPADNWQAKAYVAGAFQRFEHLDTIHFYFIAPQRNEVLYDTFHRPDLPELVEDLSGVIINAQEVRGEQEAKGTLPVERLNPGVKVCDYCANAGTCPALGKMALEVAQKYAQQSDGSLEVPENVHGSDCRDPGDMARMLKLAPMLEQWASGVKFAARKMMIEDGIDIPGYELKTKSGSRTITSPLAAYGVVQNDVTIAELLDLLGKVPVGVYEKLVMSKAPRGEKKKEARRVMAELEELGAVSRSAPSEVISEIK